ncbi:hypothetical protein LPW11_04675 [Geomonas sp. RF6]|uniref:surface-adhesin E family protein n=1 Tax=Geomonas sp. RF6 TaxID=2897342 RepID=UPI001E5CE47B|nr:surface-adhesin E family protein [Geomonas sp. RF6]UFS71495.1 hypothetical protein LPW11_04675 [Geomonas sp. RF6]
MRLRVVFAMLCVVCFSNLAHAADERWYNFAEDSDLRYYIDQKSVVNRSGDIHIFWVKSVAKSKEYYRQEYNLNHLAYILTNYEMDCSDATFRVRQTLMMDRNRRELNKSVPSGAETDFEPIPPESALELAQEIVCTGTGNDESDEKEAPTPGVSPAKPASPAGGSDADESEESAGGDEGVSIQ